MKKLLIILFLFYSILTFSQDNRNCGTSNRNNYLNKLSPKNIIKQNSLEEKMLDDARERLEILQKKGGYTAFKGGISGKVLTKNTQRMIAEIRSALGSDPIIIACGGIFDEKDVWNCLALGAGLCQAYTGFIYNGPFFAYTINKKLAKLMKEKNVNSLEEIKGLSLV